MGNGYLPIKRQYHGTWMVVMKEVYLLKFVYLACCPCINVIVRKQLRQLMNVSYSNIYKLIIHAILL